MYQRSEGFGGFGSGTATLSLDRALPVFGRAEPAPPRRFDTLDLTPDLGANIGSKDWWRGLATCLALLALTWSLHPRFHALPGRAPPAMDAAQYEEARAQAIAPLAWGADSGRHMAATDAVQLLTGTPERPVIEVSATLGQGDGLAHALVRAGVGANEAARIADMTAQITDSVAPGTALALTLGRRANRDQPRPLEKLAFRARFDMRLAFNRAGNDLLMQRMPIAIDSTPLRVSGPVGDGIFVSATGAGAPGEAVQDYIRALAPKVQLGNLPADAHYDMIVQRDRAATGEVRFGKLMYAGISQPGSTLRMIQWTIDGRTEWFDAAGVGQRRAGFAMPVDGHKTSGFGMRFHPLLGYTRMHQGVDYGAPYGSPIHAATDGIVAFAGWHGGHGNFVKLQHAGGLGTGYGHMSRIAVSPGARVSAGQVIGYVGSTGLSTGPHLHFEVYRNGAPVNPGSVNFAATSLLSGRDLAAFRAKLAAVTAVR